MNGEPRMGNPAPSRLTQHIITFGRVLRRAGLECGTPQIMDGLRALEIVGVRSPRDLYQALFSVFVTRKEQIELFDQAFELFWRAPSGIDALTSIPIAQLPAVTQRPKSSLRVRQALAENRNKERRTLKPREDDDGVDLILTYSAQELLRKKDFAEFTAEEVSAAKRLISQMSWPMLLRRTRRRRQDPQGARLDHRRTLRAAMRYHGEILQLRAHGRAMKPRGIVVLCDISGSMERYSRLLLHFMQALTDGMRKVEAFVFGTRLTRVTRHLRHSDIDVAMDAVSKQVVDWAGGTRIGEALRDFNYLWARRVLRSSSLAMIISDGWDRGDIPLLEREMSRLSRSCSQLIWLNPLLGHENYEPLTRGIQAALPHVDRFLPVHNLESLQQLGAALATM